MDALWTPYGRDRRAWHLACLNISETYLCMPGQVVRVARAGKRRAAAGCRLIFSGARPVARYTADPLDCRLRPRVPRLAASCCWQPAGNLLATCWQPAGNAPTHTVTISSESCAPVCDTLCDVSAGAPSANALPLCVYIRPTSRGHDSTSTRGPENPASPCMRPMPRWRGESHPPVQKSAAAGILPVTAANTCGGAPPSRVSGQQHSTRRAVRSTAK
jgi:hypothetical protein